MTDLVETSRADNVSSGESSPPRRTRVRWTAAAAVAAAVVTGGGVGAAAWDTRQHEAHAAALREWRSERALLAQDLAAAQELWAASEQIDTSDNGTIASDRTLGRAYTELRFALERISDLYLDIDPALSRSQDVTRAREVVEIAQAERRELERVTLGVHAATTVHAVARELVSLEAAAGELAEALDGAREHLSASEGATLDDAARVALSEAIDAATAAAGAVEVPGMLDAVAEINWAMRKAEQDVRERAAEGELRYGTDPVVSLTADGLTQSAVHIREHVAALVAARQAVTDAQSAWQAEQDRIAAEQAAAAAAAQQRSTNTSGGTSSRTGSSSSTKSRSGGANAPAAKSGSSSSGSSSSGSASSGGGGSSSGGGTWVEEGSSNWCDTTDTSGAPGVGGWC